MSMAKLYEYQGKQILKSVKIPIPQGAVAKSVDEALRMIDALQHFEKYGEVCPANWKEGDDAMKPTTDGVADYLGTH